MRVAAIDCGTNSIRLLVADVDPASRSCSDVVREMVVVRLGEGVDRTGALSAAALGRTFAATEAFAATCDALGVESLRFVATSATRDAANRDEFVRGVEARLGVPPEVISGDEEAALSFRGATNVLATGFDEPFLIVDLGGGSTELVLGSSRPTASHSMDVGCVRMTERHLRSDPPTKLEVAAASADIRAALDLASVDIPLEEARTLVGLAGSVTTVTAHALRLDAYIPDAIDGAVITIDEAVAAADDLLHSTRAARAALPFMHSGRIDVIGAGALVWREVMLRVRRDVRASDGTLDRVVTSEHDLLDGMALALGGVRET